MIFQHTHELVMSGAKTQTRRIAKEFDDPVYNWFKPLHDWQSPDMPPVQAVFRAGREIHRVGKTLAVQPGRGKKAVGRIEITGIRKEDVREISDEDAKAEGFYNAFDFLRTWVAMYDKTREFYEREGTTGLWCFYDGKPRGWITETRDGLMDMLHSRPAERYQAWVLEFRLVETS